ncbi:hypothetical protein PIB30_029385 [Stylosanthes scabra]|uniref:DUF4283 domain-containing protein n=1 Tax=Stylosanthes scabra TaxID=79078 RepID=A0ABU6UA15_9FABA|nr:hypothetical protein [Stylosanthes scabra]
MDFLLENWNGKGGVECRDVGPYRCLVVFESSAVRDEAMRDPVFLSVFDEVRPHWDIFWSRSRRVWVEVMGIPVHTWTTETFSNIAKFWGNMVLLDDKTEEQKYYSVARMLVDCFEWEHINEWVNMKVGEKEFEIYVREFGGEIFSIQSHPDGGEGRGEFDSVNSFTKMSTVVKETRLEVEDDALIGVVLGNDANGNVGLDGVNECIGVVKDGGYLREMMGHENRVVVRVDTEARGTTDDASGNELGLNAVCAQIGVEGLNSGCAQIADKQQSRSLVAGGIGPLIGRPGTELEVGVRQGERSSTTAAAAKPNGVEVSELSEGREERELDEAVQTKDFCGRSGIRFKQGDEGEILARLSDKKTLKVTKQSPKPKKQLPPKKAPCLKGRNLSTRLLCSGSNSKLK